MRLSHVKRRTRKQNQLYVPPREPSACAVYQLLYDIVLCRYLKYVSQTSSRAQLCKVVSRKCTLSILHPVRHYLWWEKQCTNQEMKPCPTDRSLGVN
jgi:hypothetical protein